MNLKALCCEVMYREMCATAARSVNQVDLEFLPKGMHDLGAPAMRQRLQTAIDCIDTSRYETLLLGYGLCSNGLVGLRCDLPMVLPRAHDCITLFLGDRQRYLDYFNSHSGAYFLTSGWIERGAEGNGLSQDSMAAPSQLGLERTREELIEKYGPENGQYIFETLHSHEKRYGTLAFIEMGVEPDKRFEQHARQWAGERGWTFEHLRGDMGLIGRLINGPWDEREFLVVPPGQTIVQAHDGQIVACGGAP